MKTIIIPGKPVAWKRTRTSRTGFRFQHPEDREWKGIIRDFAFQVFDRPLEGPVSLDILAVFPRPKGKRWKTKPMPRYWKVTSPDWDNIGKIISDALNGIAYHDDKQICFSNVKKMVAAGDEGPFTEITVESIEDKEATK